MSYSERTRRDESDHGRIRTVGSLSLHDKTIGSDELGSHHSKGSETLSDDITLHEEEEQSANEDETRLEIARNEPERLHRSSCKPKRILRLP